MDPTIFNVSKNFNNNPVAGYKKYIQQKLTTSKRNECDAFTLPLNSYNTQDLLANYNTRTCIIWPHLYDLCIFIGHYEKEALDTPNVFISIPIPVYSNVRETIYCTYTARNLKFICFS